jgi:DNA-binding CsgD family transcriptional regulator
MITIEICGKLFLSPRTVETYRKNLLEKIGTRNTMGIVLFALKNGLVG